jgi:hypothetical protein
MFVVELIAESGLSAIFPAFEFLSGFPNSSEMVMLQA